MTQTTKIAPRHVTDETFEPEVLGSANPVLVDFWAPWCGPCHAVAPILEEIAGQYVGRLGVAKLNIDENPRTPTQYGVRAIPTLVLFEDGEVKDVTVGVQSKSQLANFIEQHLT